MWMSRWQKHSPGIQVISMRHMVGPSMTIALHFARVLSKSKQSLLERAYHTPVKG